MKAQEQKIVIPCVDSYEFVCLSEIVRCEGAHNFSRVYLADGNIHKSTTTIGLFKKSLAGLAFFCCHKSHVINIHHILRYNKEGYVEMSDGSTVPVSRRNKEQFFSDIIKPININTTNLFRRPKKTNSDHLSS